MKIAGKKLEAINVVNIVLPRADGDIVLKAGGLTSFDAFEKICPIPVPPVLVRPNGAKEQDLKDEGYAKAIEEWATRRTAWMIMTSLSVTPGLEWETVDMNDPATWENYETELKSSGFTEYEMSRILAGVTSANGVNQKAIDEAEKRFLAGQGQEQ